MATSWKNKPYRGRRRADAAPLARKVENSAVESPTLLLFVVVATVGVLAYTGFLLNPANRGDWLPYGIVITAELILVAQALISMWTILSGGQDPRTFAFHHSQERLFDAATIERSELSARPHDWPMYLESQRIQVDVYITVFGEPLAKQGRGK